MAFKLPKLTRSNTNYLKNAVKSITFIAADVAKSDLVPAVSDFVESNKDFVKATYSNIRIPKMKDRRNISAFSNNKIFQAVNYGINNLKTDLASGDFYAKARADADLAEVMGFDMSDWDDLDNFDFENFDDIDNAPSAEPQMTKGDAAIVKSIEATSSASARATVNAVVSSTEQSIKSSRLISGMLFQQQEKIFASTHRDLSLIGGTLSSLFEFTKGVLGNIDSNLSEFQTEMLKTTNAQTEILKDILEIQRNQYKSAQERELENAQKRSSKRKRLGDIYGIDDYVDMVKDNVSSLMSEFGFGGDEGGLGVDSIIKMFGAAPVKEILTFGMSKMIPSIVKTATQALDTTISSVFANIMARLDNNKDDFGILGFISRIFGVNTDVSSTINTAKYEKGPVPFDGITRKAIIDVIPGYLSRIEAFLTGKPMQDFDFESGRWQDLAKGRTRFEKAKQDRINYALYDVKNAGFEDAVKNAAPSNEAEKKKWEKAANDFLNEFLAKRLGVYNANVTDPDKNGIDITKNPELYKYFSQLLKIYDTFDAEEYTDSKGRKRTRYTKSSVKAKLPAELMEARTAQQRAIEEMGSTGHSSVVKAFEYKDAAIPEFAESFVDRLAGKFGSTNLSTQSINDLFSYRDNYGNTLHTYLYNINRELQYIRLYGSTSAAAPKPENTSSARSNIIGSITGADQAFFSSRYGSTINNTASTTSTASDAARRFEAIDLRDVAYLNEQERLRQERLAAEEEARQKAEDEARQKAEAAAKSNYKKSTFAKILSDDTLDLRSFSGDERDYVLGLSKLAARGQSDKIRAIYEDVNDTTDGYNEKKVSDFFKKQFIDAGITSKELYETAISRADAQGKRTYEVISDSERSFLNKILRKIKIAREGSFLDNITAAPAKAFSNILYSADRAIYEMFFKYEFKDENGNDYNGFLDFLAGQTKSVIDKIKTQIFDPLREKFNNFIEGTIFKKENREEFFKGLKETFLGGASKIGSTVVTGTNEVIVQPALNAADAAGIKGKAEEIVNRVFNNGEEQPAAATQQVEQPAQQQTTEQTAEHNALGSLGRPYTGRTMLTKGEVLLNGRGAQVVPKTGLYNVVNSHIVNTEDAHDYLGVPGPRTTITQAKAAENAAEKRIFGRHAEGTIDIDKFINSQGNIFNKKYTKMSKDEAQQIVKDAVGDAKSVGQIAGGGLLGALISGIFGLAGGPLVGAGVGAAITLAKKSKTLQNFLFGKVGENGEREDNGIIKKSVQDAFKKYAPDMAKFAGAGFAASLITPLGPVGGIMLGAAAGYLKNNEEMRERIFGRLKIGDKEKEVIKKMLPAGLKGASVGAIATLFGGPFGLIGNAALGGAIGMMTSTEEFKKLMLGERINGVLQGGILQPIKDAFAPIAEAGNEFKDRIFSAIDDNIITPIQRFIKPTLHAIPRALGFIPRIIAQTLLDKKFALGMSGIFADLIVKPITGALMPIAKIGGSLTRAATTPVRLLGAVGNKLHKGQIDKRTDTYETAAERVAFNTDVLGRKSSQYDLNLANIGKEGGMSVERAKTISQAITLYTTSRETLSRQKHGVEREILKVLNGWKGNNGQTLPRKIKASCVKAIDSGRPAAIANILRGAGLSNNEMSALWEQLKPLIDNWTELHTKEQEARNMSDADKTKMGKDLRAAFRDELGIEGKALKNLDFNNMDQMRNISKQLNLEIEDREALAGMKAPEIQISENVDTIRDIIVKWATKGIKLADPEDDTYDEDIQSAIEKHTNLGKADRSIAKALARGTKQSDSIGDDELDDRANDELTRQVKGKGIPIVGALPVIRRLPFIGRKSNIHFMHASKPSRLVDKYSKKYGLPSSIVNVLANMNMLNAPSLKSIKTLYKKVAFDATGAGYIAACSRAKINGLVKIFNNEDFTNYFENRANNNKFITPDEIKYLTKSCHSRVFRRTLFNRLRRVVENEAWDKFENIIAICEMDGNTAAELQAKIGVGSDRSYNFFNDAETNAAIDKERKARAAGQQANATQEIAQEQQAAAQETAPDHNFLGSIIGGLGSVAGGLLGGASKAVLGLGGGLLSGLGNIIGGIGKGISNLLGFGKDKNQEGGQAQNPAIVGGAVQAATENAGGGVTGLSEDVDKRGDDTDVVYDQETSTGIKIREKNDGTVEPDTRDQATKAALNWKAVKQKAQETSQAIADKANQAITAALGAADAAKHTAKKGMGWLTKLLLGGMLAKGLLNSGVFKRIKENYLSPLWNNAIKPKLLGIGSWIINEAIPGIWNFATKTIWPKVKNFLQEDLPNFFTKTLPGLASKVVTGIISVKDFVVKDVLPTVWEFVTTDFVPFVTKYFTEDIPNLFLKNIPALGTNINEWWNGDGSEGSGAKNDILNKINEAKDAVTNWWNGDGTEGSGAKNYVSNAIHGVGTAISDLWNGTESNEGIKTWLGDAIGGVTTGIGNWWNGDGTEGSGFKNTFKDILKNDVGPFLSETFFPALGTFLHDAVLPAVGTILSSLAKSIIKGIVPSTADLVGSLLDNTVAEDNNVGATATVDPKKIIEEKGEDYVTALKDENGKKLTAKDLAEGNYKNVYNTEWAKGKKNEDGTVTFTDRSANGSEYAEAALNATLHSITNPAMAQNVIKMADFMAKNGGKVITGIGKVGSHIPVVGGAFKLGATAGNAMLQGTAKALTTPARLGVKISQSGPFKAIATKLDEALEALLTHSTILNRLKNCAIGQGISNFAAWLKNVKNSLTSVFHKATTEAVQTATDAEITTAVKAAGKALAIAQLVADFLIGCDRAESIVGVTETSFLEEIICGFINAIVNYFFIFAMYPGVNKIARWLFEKFCSDYEERRKEAEAEYEEYLKNNTDASSTKTFEEYLRQKYSATGFITESIKDAFAGVFKDTSVVTLENSPSVALSYNGDWEYTYDMTDADVAKHYSELSRKKIRQLETDAMADYRNGGGRQLEILKRIQYIKDNNPELITNDNQGQYLWTEDLSDQDILNMFKDYQDQGLLDQIESLKTAYNNYGGLGNEGELYERYLAITDRIKQEEELKKQGSANSALTDMSPVSLTAASSETNKATGLNSYYWPETYTMTDDYIRHTWSSYSKEKQAKIKAGDCTDKEQEIYTRYKYIQEKKDAKKFSASGEAVTVDHNAAGTLNLGGFLANTKIPTDYQLKNSTNPLMAQSIEATEASVFSVLQKLAGGIFGSVRVTMKDYAAAIRSSIANFGEKDRAIRAVQDGNLSIFSQGYWDFAENATSMGSILNGLAIGMGRTVAAPLLVVKSSMKSLIEDIKNIGPWMTSHFSELAGFFLHPMDYIYNAILKNYIYAKSPNASGYESPEGKVLANIMNVGGRTIIKKVSSAVASAASSGSRSSSSSSSSSSGSTSSSTSDSDTSILDRIRQTASNVGGAIRNTASNVVSWLTGDSGSSSGSSNNNKPSVIQRVANAAHDAYTSVVDRFQQAGSTIANTASDIWGGLRDTASNFGSFMGNLFGRGKYSKQIDPSISGIRYNARGDSEYQTIGDSACGPAAAVNVIESMYGRGKSVNPVVGATQFALSHGYKEQDGGTRPEFFTDYFNRFGLDSSITYDKSTVERNINAGIPTVLMGSDSRGTSSSHPFGQNPHYVTVTGTDGRGHAIVQDPESRYDDQVYDVKDLVKRTSIGVSAYGRSTRRKKYGRGTVSQGRAHAIISKIKASNKNKPTTNQIYSHPKFNARSKFGRGRDVENQDLCVWADVTAEELNNFIASYRGSDSPFNGNGALFIEIGESTGMDPVYILAHSATESGWGTSQYARERGNYFGIGAYDDNPDNAHTMASSNGDFHPDGLLAGVQWIKHDYYDAGQTTLYLFNHAADGWHNYRTSDFSPEINIMNSCYDSCNNYDSREKKKHTGDGRSIPATSANTNNSNGSSSSSSSGGTTTVVKDTRNMLLIPGLKFHKDSENDKLTVNTSSTSGVNTTSTAAPSSYNSTIRTETERGEEASQDSATDANAARQEQLAMRNLRRAQNAQEDAVHETAAISGDSLRQEQLMMRNNNNNNKPNTTNSNNNTNKPNLLERIANYFTGKGTGAVSGDYRTVNKFGRGDEKYSIGQWINRTLTDSPTAQVLNSFLDIGAPKTEEKKSSSTGSVSYSTSSSSSSSGSDAVNAVLGTGKAADVVRIAQHEAELTDGSNMENPNGSNAVKYNDWYYGEHVSGDAYPWCAAFVSWVLNKAGVGENILPKTASAPQFYENVGTHGGKYVSASDGAPGDIITFSNTGNSGGIYHVGLVENVSGGKVNTIEGNTYQGSGDWGVYRVNYDVNDSRLLLGRPNYGTGKGKNESKPMSKYGRAKDFFGRGRRRYKVPKFGTGNRASEVWNWFTKHGYSEQATAGILGNMEQESTVDPEVIQGNGAGPAAGIVQWENYNTKSSRWLNMSNYAASKGRDWTDLESQLEFIDKENKEGTDVFWSLADVYKSYDDFKKADNTIAATDSFEQAFERAGTPMMDNRYTAANNYYKQFTGKEGDPIGSVVNSTGGSSSTGGSNSGGSSGDQKYSIGQWLNRVLTDSPVAQVLNSFLDIGGGSTTTEEEIIESGGTVNNGGDASSNSNPSGNYTGNTQITSTPGAGGNSPLVVYTAISPCQSGKRTHDIDAITIHYMSSDMSVEGCGSCFDGSDGQKSSNYGVGSDGRIGMYVEENHHAWTSADYDNDDRAVTIEVANQPDGSPTSAAYNALIDLCTDICIRNNIAELKWKNDESLKRDIDQQNMTIHKWFSSTDCPGPWFSEHMGEIAADVNAKLKGSGKGKFGRGNGVKINKSKLGVFNNGLGKDGFAKPKRFSKPKFGMGATDLSPKLARQIAITKPNTKKQRLAKAIAEMTNGADPKQKYYDAKNRAKNKNKYGKGTMPPTEAAKNTIDFYKKKPVVGKGKFGRGPGDVFFFDDGTVQRIPELKFSDILSGVTTVNSTNRRRAINNGGWDSISDSGTNTLSSYNNWDAIYDEEFEADNTASSTVNEPRILQRTYSSLANRRNSVSANAIRNRTTGTITTASNYNNSVGANAIRNRTTGATTTSSNYNYASQLNNSANYSNNNLSTRRQAMMQNSGTNNNTNTSSINYMSVIREIINILITVANNTDKLNTIITILQSKLGINVNAQDVSNAQTSSNSTAYLANALMNANNRSSSLNAYSDTVNSGSLNSIIAAMNAIASE